MARDDGRYGFGGAIALVAALSLAGCAGLTELPGAESGAEPVSRTPASPAPPPDRPDRPRLSEGGDPRPPLWERPADLDPGAPVPDARLSRPRTNDYYATGRALSRERAELRRIDRELADTRFRPDRDLVDSRPGLRAEQRAAEARVRALERRRLRVAPYGTGRSLSSPGLR